MATDTPHFSQRDHLIWTPNGESLESALSKVSHLAIGAHADDLEFMAYHGIAACYEDDQANFAGVVVTDGRGSARTGPFADYSDDDMVEVRKQEQLKAAEMGRYAAMLQLGYPSSAVKEPCAEDLCNELEWILRHAQVDVLYLHNPFDRHSTHIAVLTQCIQVLKRLPPELRPGCVYGCEVWRDLDWLSGDYRVELPVDAYPELAGNLAGCFQSQIAGGKRYDLAVEGRRRAHATFSDSHRVDAASALTLAVDLSDLVNDDALLLDVFARRVLDGFRDSVTGLLMQYQS